MGIVMDFADNVTYGASDLNSLRGALATKGVIPEASSSCKAVLGEQEDTVKICAGQALFSDGSRCSVDGSGITLTVKETCYIYFKKQENGVEVMSSGSLPSGGDTVLLAQATVSTTGLTLTDMREYTVLKIPSCTVNTYDDFILKKNFNDAAVKSYDPSASLTGGKWCKVHEFDVSNHNYKYVCVFDNAEDVDDKVFLAWGNIDKGKYWTAYRVDNTGELEYGIDEMVLYHDYKSTRRIRFVKQGDKVELYYYCTMSQLAYYFDAQIRFA